MSNRISRKEWETLKVQDFERLEADVARLIQERDNLAVALQRREASAAEFARFVLEAKEQRARADALAVALARLTEACLEDIGGRHEEIQCALCLRYWPIAGPPQHDATCVLAADQPAPAGAELLAAADRLADALDQADQWLGVGPIIKSDRAEFDRDEREFKAALVDYRRARAGQLAAGPGE